MIPFVFVGLYFRVCCCCDIPGASPCGVPTWLLFVILASTLLWCVFLLSTWICSQWVWSLAVQFAALCSVVKTRLVICLVRFKGSSQLKSAPPVCGVPFCNRLYRCSSSPSRLRWSSSCGCIESSLSLCRVQPFFVPDSVLLAVHCYCTFARCFVMWLASPIGLVTVVLLYLWNRKWTWHSIHGGFIALLLQTCIAVYAVHF